MWRNREGVQSGTECEAEGRRAWEQRTEGGEDERGGMELFVGFGYFTGERVAVVIRHLEISAVSVQCHEERAGKPRPKVVLLMRSLITMNDVVHYSSVQELVNSIIFLAKFT